MNSTALAIIQPDELGVIQEAAKLLALSDYFDGKGSTPKAVAMMATKIMAGREMGFGPFASVNGIHIISGKPSIGANLMAAAVKSSARYDYRVKEMSNERCIIEFFEREGDKRVSIGISEFTKADATAAGTQNMAKFARNMLFARAMSNGVKWYCPDVFNGNAVYVPEELGAEVDGEGNVIDVTPRRVDTTTGEIVDVDYYNASQPAQQAATHAEDAKTPVDTSNLPTDAELEILGKWATPDDAFVWAVEVGACNALEHAKNSLSALITERFEGKFTRSNAAAVYLALLRHWQEKIKQPA